MSEKNNHNNFEVDTSEFDKTLREIEQTLQNLEYKIEKKKEPTKNEVVATVKKEKTIENLEHRIDDSLFPMEELHSFSSVVEEKKESSFGFYTYLTLAIVFIFAIYEILNVTKHLIVVKYPFVEPYVEYFYEVIEILTYLVINTISFIKNLF